MSTVLLCNTHVWVPHVLSLPHCYQFRNRPFHSSNFKMALIYGDSNIVKFLPLLKEKKSDPSIQATSVARATNVVLLQDLLSRPKVVYSLIIISAITNLITSKFFEDYDSMIEHCATVFNDVLLWVQEGREALDGFAETVTNLC